MASKRLSMVVFMVVMVMGAMHMQSSDAATYTVGDSLGWTIPTEDPNAYTTWAASKTFQVGDILVFNFTTNIHTAAEVTKAAYDACTLTSPISTWSNGPASVTLNSAGSHYYLCTVPSHCSAGQKLAITVSAAASPAPTPTPTAAPPTPTAATPTPTPTPTPTAAPPTPTPTAATPTPTPTPTTTPTPSPTPAPTPTPASTPSPAPAPTPSSGAPASSPSESTPPPAPTPGSTTPSTPAPGTPDTPTTPSSASFLSAALPLTFLSIAIALYY